MASNYKNSAGTDLDSLFLVNNSNAGALGFKISDGTDLGNRYSNSSTLQQTIGYKNNAGTDIGYLRGKVSAVSSFSTYSIGMYKEENVCGHTTNNNVTYTDTCEDCDGNGENCRYYDCPQHPYVHWRSYIMKFNFATDQPVTKAVLHVHMAPKYNTPAKRWIAAVRLGNAYVTPNTTTDWPNMAGCYTCSNVPEVATLTKTYSTPVTSDSIYFGIAGGTSYGENHFVCRVSLTVYNDAGNKTGSNIENPSWFKAYW